jgi:transcriptional regulator GlxA family with amidase domain
MPEILIVDAGFVVVSFLDVTLTGRCHVTSVATVIGAVQSLVCTAPDVVIVGASVAVNHAGFLRELGERFPATRVIAVEATGEPAMTHAMTRTTLDRVFARPTDLAALLARVIALVSLEDEWRGRLACISPYVTRAVAHVAAHYRDDATVAGVARAVGISPDHLGRLFEAVLGLPVKEYIIRVRLLVAKRLLLQTDEGLDALAEECGFVDGSHLSRLFLRYTGQRPGEYRRALKRA